MTKWLYCYLIGWMIFCCLNLFFLIKIPSHFTITSSEYARFLLRPWKVATFAIALSGIVLIAPYTGDPTWDYVDATFMSVLTFMTAPWSIGIIYQSFKSRLFNKSLLLAICLWMFSASWSYDLYLLVRDGYYPITWFPNIFASSFLYISAGLLWNLDWREERGVTFSFLEKDWFFIEEKAGFTKVFWMSIPFMLMAFIAIISFVL